VLIEFESGKHQNHQTGQPNQAFTYDIFSGHWVFLFKHE
jgi:hypothetical protein